MKHAIYITWILSALLAFAAKPIEDLTTEEQATFRAEIGAQATIADGDLTIAKTNGLQTALDGKLANTNSAVNSAISTDPAATRKAANTPDALFYGPVGQNSANRMLANTIGGSPAPYTFRQWHLGDSYAKPFTYEACGWGVEREWGFGATYEKTSGAGSATNQFEYTPSGTIQWTGTAGGNVYFSSSAASFECYKIGVLYVKEDGAGTFKLQTSTNGGAWTDVTGAESLDASGSYGSGATATATISGGVLTGVTVTNGGSGYTDGKVAVTVAGGTYRAICTATVTGGAVSAINVVYGSEGFSSAPAITILPLDVGSFTYSFSTTEPRKLRAVGVSGNVRIIGMLMSDFGTTSGTNRGGCSSIGFAQGGIDSQSMAITPQIVWDAIAAMVPPDVITYKSDDADYRGSLPVLTSKINAALAKVSRAADYIFVGKHPTNAGGYPAGSDGQELVPADVALRDFALTQPNSAFFNSRALFKNSASMVASGMAANLDPHLSARGEYVESAAILKGLEAMASPSATYKERLGLQPARKYEMGTQALVAPAGKKEMIAMYGTTGTGASYKPFYTIAKLSDDSDPYVGFTSGANAYIREIRGANFSWWNAQPYGWSSVAGFTAPTRGASGLIELWADSTSNNLLTLSSSLASPTTDVMRTYVSATSSSAGTQKMSLKANGDLWIQKLKISSLSICTDNADAISKGLSEGDLYRTSSGQLMIVYTP